MTQYRVTISHDACTVHDVESCSPEEAAERAMESCGSVTLCHHCSDELQMGDPIRAACVENLEDGTHIDAVDPEVAELEAAAQPLTDEQILDCVRSVGVPAPMGLTRDRGPYEITEPSWFLTQLVHAIERAHGIGQPANKPGATK